MLLCSICGHITCYVASGTLHCTTLVEEKKSERRQIMSNYMEIILTLVTPLERP